MSYRNYLTNFDYCITHNEYIIAAVNVERNATCSSQKTRQVLYELVSTDAPAMNPSQISITHQYGVSNATHRSEQAAAMMADTVCTLLSNCESLNLGAVPTNAMDAGAKNAKN